MLALFVLQEQADRSQRAAKYAAVLALAGVDPVVAHQNASFRFLVDYVRRRRYAFAICPLSFTGPEVIRWFRLPWRP